MSDDDTLQAVREHIDRIDEQLQALITERAKCAEEVARRKDTGGDDAEYYRPEREAEILRAVAARNQGPLGDDEMVRLFREIMSSCLALQHPMSVAFLGPEGTFTQEAVYRHFGHAVTTLPMGAIDEVFREVEAGTAHYGVVPIENSTEGVINHTLDMFMNSPLKICSEVELRIHHFLLGTMNSPDEVKAVEAHQQALAQCREWLDANLPAVQRRPVNSNAEAAQHAARQKGVAAIAGEAAAGIYNLNVIVGNIEDEPENTTRFLVIGRRIPEPSGRDKTSLLLTAPNRPGALYELLKPFAESGISMTRIESRPSRRGTWDYVFFVDIEGHVRDAGIASAIRQLESVASMVKVLGSYPWAVLPPA